MRRWLWPIVGLVLVAGGIAVVLTAHVVGSAVIALGVLVVVTAAAYRLGLRRARRATWSGAPGAA